MTATTHDEASHLPTALAWLTVSSAHHLGEGSEQPLANLERAHRLTVAASAAHLLADLPGHWSATKLRGERANDAKHALSLAVVFERLPRRKAEFSRAVQDSLVTDSQTSRNALGVAVKLMPEARDANRVRSVAESGARRNPARTTDKKLTHALTTDVQRASNIFEGVAYGAH